MYAAIAAVKAAMPKAQADPLRPRYHFLPPANWMNDPNGTIYINSGFFTESGETSYCNKT